MLPRFLRSTALNLFIVSRIIVGRSVLVTESSKSAVTSGCWQCTNKREIKRAGLYIRDCHDAVLLYVRLLRNKLLATAFIWAGKSFPNIRNRIHLLFGDVTNSLVLYRAEKRSQMASALDFLKVQNPRGIFFFVWCKVQEKKGNFSYSCLFPTSDLTN